MSFRFRELEKADLDKVMEIENASFTEPWSRNSFETALDAEANHFIAVENEGTLIGYAGIGVAADEGELLTIAVEEKHRKKGVASKLLEYVLIFAEEWGLWSIYLEVRVSNEAALKLYHKYNFDEIGKRKGYYTNPPEDACLMQRVI